MASRRGGRGVSPPGRLWAARRFEGRAQTYLQAGGWDMGDR